MRIRTRLFLGTALLVLGLLLVQWWLQKRQVEAIRSELARVAASVSESLVLGQALDEPVPRAPADTQHYLVGTRGDAVICDAQPAVTPEDDQSQAPGDHEVVQHITITGESAHKMVWVERDERSTGSADNVLYRKVLVPSVIAHAEAKASGQTVTTMALALRDPSATEAKAGRVAPREGRTDRIEFVVTAGTRGNDNVLIVSGQPRREIRVPVDLTAATDLTRATLHKSLLAGGVLLLAGMGGAAVFAHRFTRPVQRLVAGAEAVGRGEVGTQVDGVEEGELGELLSSFNAMSARLAALEKERTEWQARKHLAELGDLARGLAHTLRNPLNTLGLAIEELAERGGEGGTSLATTARQQIRRIDRWLLSFLSVGANGAAAIETVDLEETARSVVLETALEGFPVELHGTPERLAVKAVPGALRAAVTNLVENAIQASPPGAPVEVVLERCGDHVCLMVLDRGAGIPDPVREKLFAPHVTTKVGGAGMGLFLARQLIEAGHGGVLEIVDREGGGTLARVTLPLDDDDTPLTGA